MVDDVGAQARIGPNVGGVGGRQAGDVQAPAVGGSRDRAVAEGDRAGRQVVGAEIEVAGDHIERIGGISQGVAVAEVERAVGENGAARVAVGTGEIGVAVKTQRPAASDTRADQRVDGPVVRDGVVAGAQHGPAVPGDRAAPEKVSPQQIDGSQRRAHRRNVERAPGDRHRGVGRPQSVEIANGDPSRTDQRPSCVGVGAREDGGPRACLGEAPRPGQHGTHRGVSVINPVE